MNEKKTNISLELLLMNELLNKNVIDNTIYEMAAKKFKAVTENMQGSHEQVTLPATA